MTIAFTNLGASANPDINNDVNLTSYSNSSWTPPTDGLILVFVQAQNAAGGAGPTTPTISGNSLTWVQIGSTLICDGEENGLSLFAADASGATTGATTIDFGSDTQTHCCASFFQATGVNLSGGVASAFVQQPTNTGTGSSGSVSLAAAGGSGNRPIVCFWHLANESVAPRTNWTEIDEFTGLGQARGINSQYRDDAFETTASATWSTSAAWAGMAAELLDESSVSAGGTITPTGTLLKAVSDFVAGALAPVGALANSLLTYTTVLGQITPAGVVNFILNRVTTVEGELAPAGEVSFQVSTAMTGSLTPTGSMGLDSITTIPEEPNLQKLMYIEQVKFSEPYGLQLVGGDDHRLDVLLSRIVDTAALIKELRSTFHSTDREIVTKGGKSVDDAIDNLYPPDGEGGLVPIGGVVFWPCDAGDIPLGWQVYTPAQGRFLVGADDIDFICGVDGGALTIDLEHQHGPGTLSTNSDSHSHGPGTLETASDNHSHSSGTLATDSDSHSHSSGTLSTSSDSHSHTIEPPPDSYDGVQGGTSFDAATRFHNHTGTTGSDNHNHDVTTGTTGSDSHSHDVTTGTTGSDSHSHDVTTGTTASDSHSHTVDTGLTDLAGNTAQSILPPYHVGTWIQFVGTNPL